MSDNQGENAIPEAEFERERAEPRYLQPGEPTDDILHDVEFNPEQATKLAPGVTLLTLDGTKIGNGIVVRRNGHTSSFPGSRDVIPLWMVETDFGNVIPAMQASEIFGLWNLGYVRTYDLWWEARFERIKAALQENAERGKAPCVRPFSS